MMNEITAKTFYKQLTGSAAGALTATIIGGAVCGFCAIFCGTQLGWTHIFTIIGLIALALCIGLLIFFIVKTARMKQHPVFRRYGSAEMLAQKINEGLQHPRYFAKGFDENIPFATLMTNEFIVGSYLVSYMELKDIRSAQPAVIPDTRRVVVGNPAMTVGSMAANYATDRMMEAKGINSQTKFDMILMKNAEGKQENYSIRHMDMEAFLKLLQEVAPHIQINYNVKTI